VVGAAAALVGAWVEVLSTTRSKGRQEQRAAGSARGGATERFPVEVEVNAYVLPSPVARDDARAAEFAAAAEALTWVSPFSHRALPDGSIESPDDGEVRALAELSGAAPLLVLTNSRPNGAFDTDAASALLERPDAQERLLDSVDRLRAERGYRGLSVDFERLRWEDRPRFADFLRRAAEREHAANGVLVTAVAPKYHADQSGIWHAGHDYSLHGAVADRVVVMAYEWGHSEGPPAPVAPLDEVRKVLRYAISEIPREKLLLGVPLYGYDWALGEDHAERPLRLGVSEALELAAREGAAVQYDVGHESPWFRYIDAAGREHLVWFENRRSLTAKLDLARALGLRGVSFWRLPDPGGQALEIVHDLFAVAKLAGPGLVSAA
jgi:spore germination protein